MEKEPITIKGLEKLKRELEELKNIMKNTKSGAMNTSIYPTEENHVE